MPQIPTAAPSPPVRPRLSLGCLARAACPDAPVAQTQSSPPDAEGFDRLLAMANRLSAQGSNGKDAAMELYWRAIRAVDTYDQAKQVAVATLDQGFGYRDLKLAALSACMKRADTRTQALELAQLAWSQPRHTWDSHAVAALERALKLSTTPAQALEIADLAKQHEHLHRYHDVQESALQAVGRLTR